MIGSSEGHACRGPAGGPSPAARPDPRRAREAFAPSPNRGGVHVPRERGPSESRPGARGSRGGRPSRAAVVDHPRPEDPSRAHRSGPRDAMGTHSARGTARRVSQPSLALDSVACPTILGVPARGPRAGATTSVALRGTCATPGGRRTVHAPARSDEPVTSRARKVSWSLRRKTGVLRRYRHGGNSRRRFLKGGAGAVASFAVGGVRGAEPSGKIVMGVIGPGGMGTNLLRSFASRKDVAMAWVCDSTRVAGARLRGKPRRRAGRRPQPVKDLRQVLDDRAVDAVVIATPDHWHAPAAILACEAGKHVYVEKPCCPQHPRGAADDRGRPAQRRVVQVGTQSRSTPHVSASHEAAPRRGDRRGAGRQGLEQPAAGQHRPRRSRASRRRSSTYDLWLGPGADASPTGRTCSTGIWRWWYDFGCGDIGNDGVHDIDIARWGLGVETHPSHGRRPRRQVLLRRRPAVPRHAVRASSSTPATASRARSGSSIFEQRIWSPYVQEGYENGNAFYGTKGMMILGKKAGWKLYGPRNKLRRGDGQRRISTGPPTTRLPRRASATAAGPNADIEIGHLSAILSHLGNIAARVGGRCASIRRRSRSWATTRRPPRAADLPRRATGRSRRACRRKVPSRRGHDSWVERDRRARRINVAP